LEHLGLHENVLSNRKLQNIVDGLDISGKRRGLSSVSCKHGNEAQAS